MARFFRLLDKKRGLRRTGSNYVGSLGEVLFYSTVFFLGLLLLTSLVLNFTPAVATFGRGWWLMAIVLGSMVILGGVGLIWTVLRLGVSLERRSALAKKASQLDLLEGTGLAPRDLPTVPEVEGLTNSPGIELAYRLPPVQTPGWRLLSLTLFTLAWVGTGSVLSLVALQSHLSGSPDWGLSIFILPHAAVSVWLVRRLALLLWAQTGMGPTTVEISDMPLRPGQEYQAAFWQHGHMRVRSLSLSLQCLEEATYHQGTDIRTEIRVVWEEQLAEHCDFDIDPRQPFQALCTLKLPLGAMHSFQTAHNAVHWRLVVRGQAEKWEDFERQFPVVVLPGRQTSLAMPATVFWSAPRNPLRSAPPAAGILSGAAAAGVPA